MIVLILGREVLILGREVLILGRDSGLRSLRSRVGSSGYIGGQSRIFWNHNVSQKPFRDSRHDKDTFCYESIGTINGHRLGLSSIQPV